MSCHQSLLALDLISVHKRESRILETAWCSAIQAVTCLLWPAVCALEASINSSSGWGVPSPASRTFSPELEKEEVDLGE